MMVVWRRGLALVLTSNPLKLLIVLFTKLTLRWYWPSPMRCAGVNRGEASKGYRSDTANPMFSKTLLRMVTWIAGQRRLVGCTP